MHARRWRDLLRASGPLAIRAKSRLQLQRLGAARTTAIGELEVEGQERGAAGKKGNDALVENVEILLKCGRGRQRTRRPSANST